MSFSRQDNPTTRPYLLRALHEWCSDNGLTPYLAVQVDASVQVPFEYVKNGEIVLNVSVDSTSALRLGNDFIEFKARFGGVVRDIVVPVDHVIAIYAKENGQGMAFPAPVAAGLTSVPQSALSAESGDGPEAEVAEPKSDASGSPSSEPRTVLRAVPTEPKTDALTDEDDGPEPTSPASGQGSAKRPTLKRIK